MLRKCLEEAQGCGRFLLGGRMCISLIFFPFELSLLPFALVPPQPPYQPPTPPPHPSMYPATFDSFIHLENSSWWQLTSLLTCRDIIKLCLRQNLLYALTRLIFHIYRWSEDIAANQPNYSFIHSFLYLFIVLLFLSEQCIQLKQNSKDTKCAQ